MGTKNNPGAFDAYEAALPDEPIFTLLGRDASAPETIRYWAAHREENLRLFTGSMNGAEFFHELDQIAEARQCADAMDAYRPKPVYGLDPSTSSEPF